MNKSDKKSRPALPEKKLDEKLAGFWRLLDKFSMLPDYVLDRTLLDISGYPHYENVCSNILAFYFDPSNEHGMKDLLLKSFLFCVDANLEVPVFEQANVRREEPTRNNKRLDLLIETDGFVIGIENKIYHDVNNPFDEYEELINQWAGENKTPVKVILGLRHVKETDRHCGFVSITYQQWFGRLIEVMGPYLLTAASKHQYYLFDFIKTIKRLSGEGAMNEETIRFFKQHHRLVNDLIDDYSAFKKELNNSIPVLQGLVPITENSGVTQFIWDGRCLVHEFDVGMGRIVIDTYVFPHGWRILLFTKQKETRVAVEKIREAIDQRFNSKLLKDNSGTRYVMEEFDLDTSEKEISEYLNERIQFIAETISLNPDLSGTEADGGKISTEI